MIIILISSEISSETPNYVKLHKSKAITLQHYILCFFLFCQDLHEGPCFHASAQLMMCLYDVFLVSHDVFLPHLGLLGILVTCNASKWEERHRRQFGSVLHFLVFRPVQ